MKKLFVPLALVAIVFASCKKYETSDPLDLSTLPTVTVTGTVYAELDETIGGLEFPPSGQSFIRVSVPYANYSTTNPSGGNWVSDLIEVSSDGKFSVNVPVVPSGVTATISFRDFTGDVKKLNAVGQTYTESAHFSCTDKVISGLGKTEVDHIYDFTYTRTTHPNNNTLSPDPVKAATISGKLEYQSDDTTWRVVSEGTRLTAIITLVNPNISGKEYKEIQQVTVGYGGIYSLKVPMIERGKATVELTAENFWEFTILSTNKRAIHRYTLNQSITVFDYSSQTGKNYRYTKQEKVNDLD
jgi:hypothetical protein